MAWDIVANVRAPKNAKVLFVPLNGLLESEFRRDELTGAISAQVQYVCGGSGTLPGHQIRVDTKNEQYEIVDLLNDPENLQIVRRINEWKARQENPETPLSTHGDIQRQNCVKCGKGRMTATAQKSLPTWLWHLRNLYETGRIKLLKGSIPERDAIRRMGDVFLGESQGLKDLDRKPVAILPKIEDEEKTQKRTAKPASQSA